ncbi:hypothetical protein KI387_013956 [Taxus chinensis]|uniref:Protein GAMETE EXPRESSED 1 n=1 Tax=Taxus chinensis TaxID=29808 RepID=A0AA38CTD9_TAXCH|nr:hypothetical protein KI387_013956 [Taxus chinensis]
MRSSVSGFLILLILLSWRFYAAHGWGWFSSSSEIYDEEKEEESHGSDFDIEALDNAKGKQLVKDAKERMVISGSCWQQAYSQLFSSCREILQEEEKKSRLAWHMTDCFQRESGRGPLPSCSSSTLTINCLKKLNDGQHKVYLAFFINTNAMCHHLQSHAFKRDTERVVNELKSSAHWLVDKMDKIEKKSDSLLESSDQIHDSLVTIESQAAVLMDKSKAAEDKITNVLEQSNAIFEQSHQITDTQSKLQEEQLHMQNTMDSSMANLGKYYASLGEGIGFLQTLTKQTQMELTEVAGTMSSQLNNLQNKADDIRNVVTVSLNQQQQLLSGQSLALQGLDTLSQHQAEAFQESRASLQQLADGARQHQIEFSSYQKELQQTHERLAHSSSAILAAQEAFESKQSTMLMALDKLFSLYNSILLESRAAKTIFFYLVMLCVLYLLTSAKQTNDVRGTLYLGLCTTFGIEFFIARIKVNDILQQDWISSKTFYVRTAFTCIAILHLAYSLIRYRDYERLNYRLLLEIQEKMKMLEPNLDNNRDSIYRKNPELMEFDRKASQYYSVRRAPIFQRQRSLVGDMDHYSYVTLLSAQLGEEDSSDDPDYELPLSVKQKDSFTPKTYNFRPRSHN